MEIILLLLAKLLEEHRTTLVHITYPALVDAAKLTLPVVMLYMMDSLNFNLESLHKQHLAETVRKFLLLSYLS